MVIKIFYVAIAIFSVAMVFLSLQEPYSLQTFKEDVQLGNLELKNVVDYEVGQNISAKLMAKSAVKFKDYDEFKDFKGTLLQNNINHTLTSDIAIHKGDELIFKNNAKYQNSDNINYTSQEIIYDTKAKIVQSKTPFTMWQNSDKVTGNSIKYDIDKKQTTAKGVKAWYTIKEK